MPATIVLVRHGQTDWNRDSRFQGHADTPLNDAGREQAAELAAALANEGLIAVYTSPLCRALETATIVGTALGVEPRPLEALREIDVGDWEGLSIHEVRERYPDRADTDWRSGWPNGETHEQLAERVVPALVALGEAHDGEQVLGVTHAGPIRAALMAATGLTHEESRTLVGPLKNCAIFRFAVRDGRLERAD